MEEKMFEIDIKGKPGYLLGRQLGVGETAPNFTVVDKNLQPVELADFAGRVIVLNSLPSVDTPVCKKQLIKFNQEVSLLHNAIILSVSMDLPFALSRFCGTYGIRNVIATSDYQYQDFGMKYGTIIADLKILARAVFVIDKEGIIRYAEYVKAQTDLPDFNAVYETVKKYA